MNTTSSAIVFDDVYRRFNKQEVLRGLTFRVEPGTVYALLGRNGCGKSTAIRILLGFLRPHHGTASILDCDSTQLTPAHRARIAYVTEGHKLYGSMKVDHVLRFEAGTRKTFELAEARKHVSELGLDSKKRVRRLSRGQRAQLALAIAAASRPEVLVFDDPALGLDAVMRRELLDAMISLLSDRGCAVLMTSHILTDVERMADRVGILRDGQLIVDATVDDMKRRVTQRHWIPQVSCEPPVDARIVSSRPTRTGHELTLVDCNRELESLLTRSGETLTRPKTPTLEEFFVNLVGGSPAVAAGDRKEAVA